MKATHVDKPDSTTGTKKETKLQMIVALNGKVLDSEQNVTKAVAQIAEAVHSGAKVVVIHGGRPQINECLDMQGITSQFADGMRITDDAAMNAAFAGAGHVNAMIVDALKLKNVSAIGLHAEPHLLTCKKKNYKNAQGETIDLGWVGDILAVDVPTIEKYFGETIVLSHIGTDGDKNRYNLSVEETARAVAKALNTDSLLLITDVPN